jgi:predicted transcriptional regulator
MAKQKFSISMDAELVKRIDAVAEAREEGRATVIERMCRNDIEEEEKFLKQFDNRGYRAVYDLLATHPRLIQQIATLVGEELSDEDRDHAVQVLKKRSEAAKGKKRSGRGRRKDSQDSER